jgi:hypothetical protein
MKESDNRDRPTGQGAQVSAFAPSEGDSFDLRCFFVRLARHLRALVRGVMAGFRSLGGGSLASSLDSR